MIIAQATEAGAKLAEQAGGKLVESGSLGVVILLLFALLFLRDFYFDRKRDTREQAREESRSKEVDRLVVAVSAHDEARDKKIETLVQSMHDLVQSNLLETLSRPHLVDRARTDAEALQRKVGRT